MLFSHIFWLSSYFELRFLFEVPEQIQFTFPHFVGSSCTIQQTNYGCLVYIWLVAETFSNDTGSYFVELTCPTYELVLPPYLLFLWAHVRHPRMQIFCQYCWMTKSYHGEELYTGILGTIFKYWMHEISMWKYWLFRDNLAFLRIILETKFQQNNSFCQGLKTMGLSLKYVMSCTEYLSNIHMNQNMNIWIKLTDDSLWVVWLLLIKSDQPTLSWWIRLVEFLSVEKYLHTSCPLNL